MDYGQSELNIKNPENEDLYRRILELEVMVKWLKKKESHMKQVIQNMIDLVYKTDLAGIIQYITPSNRMITGYEQSYLVGRSIFDFIHPEDMEGVRKSFNSCIYQSQPSKIIYRFRAKSGYIWLETIGKKVYNTKNVLIGFIFSSRDITERVSIERALKKSEERYRKLVELFPEAIFITIDSKNVYSNIAGARLLGFNSPEQLWGRDIFEFIYPDYINMIKERMDCVCNRGENVPLCEWVLLRQDGKTVDVESMSMAIPYFEKTAMLSVIHDITERKLSEELKAKIDENKKLLIEAIEYDKLKTDFFSNISHELRTPLNVILGALQTFKLVFDGDNAACEQIKIMRYTGIMKQNCYRLLRLVNNLIDITKIDSGFFEVQLKNCNIVRIIEDITLSVADYIEQKGIDLIFDTDVEEKYTACDPDKIERIILNLLSNAIKFTHPGGNIIVTVEDMGDYICVRVKDDGIGIPPEKLNEIFERFRQVDKSLTRNREGSGIGLSLVQSLVKLHEGSICVESMPGVGSEFIIELPIRSLEVEQLEVKDINDSHSRIERIHIEFSDIYS